MKKMPRTTTTGRGMARPVLVRAGTALAIAFGFLWVVSSVDPDPTRAVSDENAQTTAASNDSNSLGSLEGKDYIVRIVATDDGPRYTVSDHLGNTIASGMTEDEVYREFPELTIDRMITGPVMMVPMQD